jgi:hypothetical protein
MPNQFLDTLLANTAVPVTVAGSLDGHPDSIVGERRDPKTQTPLQSDADLMTETEGVGRSIFSAGRQALAVSYQTKSDIAQAVKGVTENIPPHVVNGRRQPGAVVGDNGEMTYTRIRADAIIPLRESATSRFTAAAKRIDVANNVIQEGIASLSRVIDASIETKPTHADDVGTAAETRAYCSKLDQNQRVSFVKGLIDQGDVAGCRAILGKSSCYLSGLSKGEYGALRQIAEQSFNKREFAQREIAYKILRSVDSAGSQLVGSMATLLGKTARLPVNKSSDALAILKGGK